MKERIFLIIAGIVVTGVVAYKICRHFCKTTCEDCKKKSTSNENDSVHNAPHISTSEETQTPTVTDVYKTRDAVVHSVRERHGEAAKAMEQSLNTIFNDSENDDIVTENSQTLRETRSDLDDLLK